MFLLECCLHYYVDFYFFWSPNTSVMALVSIPRKGRCLVHANAFQGCARLNAEKEGIVTW